MEFAPTPLEFADGEKRLIDVNEGAQKCSKNEFTNRNLLVITFIRSSCVIEGFSVFSKMSRHERSFIVCKSKRIPDMQATTAARSTKLYSNDVM